MGFRIPYFKLNNGNQFPLLGFGTYHVKGLSEVTRILDEALTAGYRSFDTARYYENEKDLGTALKFLLPKHNLKRSDIYLTSKLWTDCHGGGNKTESTVRDSINDLQCEYLDLYLIHWPGVDGLDPADPENSKQRRKTWYTLAKLHRQGLLKSIGVSNYNIRHITELIENCDGVKPAVNQIEWHPHHHPEDLHDECKKHGILLQAFASLGGSITKAVLNDTEVHEIAERINQPIGSVLLKWAIQKNVAVIPKAASSKHIYQNIDLEFTIPEDLMYALDNLSTQIKYDWDSRDVV